MEKNGGFEFWEKLNIVGNLESIGNIIALTRDLWIASYCNVGRDEIKR